MYKYLRKYIDIFSKHNRCSVFFLCIGLFSVFLSAQNKIHSEYIERYKNVAIAHQKQYGIPASITLAQGLLESNAGQSRLAKEANNHFGIKCGGTWKGKTFKHEAETGKECFRKYKTVEDSYRDHSLFLKRKRYELLFTYKISDYKKWAKGLYKCGYATDPKYAEKLIGIIERYELNELAGGTKIAPKQDEIFEQVVVLTHALHRKGTLLYVKANEGDTYESIAKEFGVKKKKLLSYNDLKSEQALLPGDIVYLKGKNKKYKGKERYYVVNEGETLYTVSQKLGVRLKNLRKMNKKKSTDEITLGETLKIR